MTTNLYIAMIVLALFGITGWTVHGVFQSELCKQKGGQYVRTNTGYICAKVEEIK